jgi:hypothetical protein
MYRPLFWLTPILLLSCVTSVPASIQFPPVPSSAAANAYTVPLTIVPEEPPSQPIIPLLTPAPDLPSVNVAGRGIKNADQLVDFFLSQNPAYPDMRFLENLADYYVREAAIEGINSDVAWVQMCLETGYLRYGGLVTPDMNNFCGLGSRSSAEPGARFPTPLVGVRAHIQHLHAYATTYPLRQSLVDPRYHYVQRGRAPDVTYLAGTWAADKSYGNKLVSLLEKLASF